MIKISKIAIIASAIIIGSALLSLASGLWNPAWNPFKPASGGDVFIEALSKSLAAKTFNLSGLLEVDAETATAALGGDASQPKNVKIGLEVQEQIDKTDTENIKANGQIKLGIETEGMTISGDFEIRGFGENAYFKIVSLPSFLPLPIDVEQIKGQWIKLNLKDLQDKLAAAGLQMPVATSSQDFQTTLKNLQELVKGKKFFDIKERLGKENILGMDAEHYTVALNKKAVKDFVIAYLDLAEKYAPENQKEEVKQQLSDIKRDFDVNFEQHWKSFGGLFFEIWVEQGTGRLVKFKWENDIDPSKLGNAQQNIKKMKLKIELGLSQFNKKFDIEEPTDFKTAEELLGGLTEQLIPATSTLP